MQVQIREITIDNHEAMVAVWIEAGLPTKPEGRDGYDETSRQMARDPDLFLGAFQDEVLVGVVIGTYDGRKGHVNRLAVLPSVRGRGVGRQLLAACEGALRGRGVEVICALVETPNDPSMGLFQASGYHHHRDIAYLAKRDRQEA